MKNRKLKPPFLANWFLKRFAKYDEDKSLNGDFDEEFFEFANINGAFSAWCWYWRQIFYSLPIIIKDSTFGSISMFKNYVKTAYRNIIKQKVNSTINITGLALGITCCTLIYLYVADELSYDNFHENNDSLYRIVRVLYNNADGSVRLKLPDMVPAMGPVFKNYFPEIKYQSRFTSANGTVQYKDKIFNEKIHLADTFFFEMFTFPLLSVNPETAASTDNSIVLTESIAKKYFGSKNPIGETILITFGEAQKEFIINAVAKDPPKNSSIQFQSIINISNLTFATGVPNYLDRWNWWSFPVFVQLNDGTTPNSIEQRIDAFVSQYFTKELNYYRTKGGWTRKENPLSFELQKMKDVYLNASVYGGKGFKTTFILSDLAFVILIIASINCMNLSIGMSSVRSNEIGMRKVLGANRKQLIRQFWSESLVLAFFSMVIALALVSIIIPSFNALSEKNLSVGDLLQPQNLIGLSCIAFFAGILSGSYPALVMARFKPTEIMKGKFRLSNKNLLTKGLVVVQFSLSIILIISALLLGKQLKYLVTKDLGYQKEGLISILIQEKEEETAQRLVNLFQNKLKFNPNIKGVTASVSRFGISSGPNVGRDEKSCHYNRVDPNFLNVLELELVEGRNFSQDRSTDKNAAIVNQKFLQTFEVESPIGKLIQKPFPEFLHGLNIVGVVKDFHFNKLHSKIMPAIYLQRSVHVYNRMLVRVSPNSLQETVTFLGNTWKEIQPDKPFTYFFQDDLLERLYDTEKRWSAIVRYSSIFSIIIACMGIFGLTAITTQKRIKEIGIRKLLGAKVTQIINIILKEFIFLVIIANLIAFPIVYLIIKQIIQNYPYRIEIGIEYFLLAGISSLLISISTIIYLAVKTAITNPINALKYE